jgi:putative membrane protein (TIGR04086 family)
MEQKIIIIKGASIALGFSTLLLGIALFQALLNSQPVNNLSGYSRLFMATSLIVGGYYAGMKVGKKGWMVGGSVGLIYCLIGLIGSVMLIPRILSFMDLFDALVPGTVLAGMAGVCGVNIERAKKRRLKAGKMQIKRKLNG